MDMANYIEKLNDIRITTHYYQDNLPMSLFSVIHEAGHGLYELGIQPAYRNTIFENADFKCDA